MTCGLFYKPSFKASRHTVNRGSTRRCLDRACSRRKCECPPHRRTMSRPALPGYYHSHQTPSLWDSQKVNCYNNLQHTSLLPIPTRCPPCPASHTGRRHPNRNLWILEHLHNLHSSPSCSLYLLPRNTCAHLCPAPPSPTTPKSAAVHLSIYNKHPLGSNSHKSPCNRHSSDYYSRNRG